MRPATPANEAARLKALSRYNILDTAPEGAYDDLVYLASHICGTPTALVTLVDHDRQWFKAKLGFEASQTPREDAFCAHAILRPDSLLVVPNTTQDARFCDNPLVTGGPHIRFYAGAPLVTDDHAALGTLCVIDSQPHELSPEQARALQALARQVMAQLQLRLSGQELQQANRELTLLACTDALTKVHNRGSFDELLAAEVSRARRYGLPLSLALLDVDHFKQFNDAFGHPSGDEVLRSVAQTLKSGCRACDIVARYGGEEFVVILPSTPLAGAIIIAERLRQSLQDAPWPLRAITASFGVCELGPQTMSSKELVGQADLALYEAKRQGRNRVVPGSDL